MLSGAFLGAAGANLGLGKLNRDEWTDKARLPHAIKCAAFIPECTPSPRLPSHNNLMHSNADPVRPFLSLCRSLPSGTRCFQC